MRRTLIATLLMLLAAPPAIAQQPSAGSSTHAANRGASRLIWTGTILMAAGAITLPVTGTREDPSTPTLATGLGLMGAGSYLLWLGVSRQRSLARQPHSAVRVMVGSNRSGVQFSRTW